jgi:hypothetical protein
MSEQTERARRRYAEDAEYRMRRLASINAWRKANRQAINARRRLRWATDPAYRARQLAARRSAWRRGYDLKRLYGITLEEYERLFARQKGRCALCRKTSAQRLQVDHCHRTGAVRRLLCGRCNRGLGHFDDDPRLVRRAAAYLEARLKLSRRGKPRVRHGGSAPPKGSEQLLRGLARLIRKPCPSTE